MASSIVSLSMMHCPMQYQNILYSGSSILDNIFCVIKKVHSHQTWLKSGLFSSYLDWVYFALSLLCPVALMFTTMISYSHTVQAARAPFCTLHITFPGPARTRGTSTAQDITIGCCSTKRCDQGWMFSKMFLILYLYLWSKIFVMSMVW